MKKITALLIITVLLLSLAGCGGKTEAPKADEAKAEADLAPIEGDYADITIKGYGTITFKFEPEAAPISVDNFKRLAASGFYDGLTFHRIMEGFMMQGGMPADKSQTPDRIKGEFTANGWDNPLSHTAGAVSMARASDFDSANSQFFIVHKDSKFLDGQYAVFGYVTEGMDIVDKICTEAKPTDGNGTIPADQQPVIESIVIR